MSTQRCRGWGAVALVLALAVVVVQQVSRGVALAGADRQQWAVSRVQPVSSRPACPGDPVAPLTDAESEVEPSIAVNPADPDNIVAAWVQGSVVAAASFDGGTTWAQVTPPGLGLCSGGTDATVANPWVSFGPADLGGRQVVYLSAEMAPHLAGAIATHVVKVVVSRSTDGGRTFGEPVVVDESPIGGRNEAPTVTADPVRPGRAYAVWSKHYGLYAPASIQLSRTDDAGASWSTPQEVYRPPGVLDDVFDSRLRVLSDGSLLHVFLLDPNNDEDPLTGPPVREMAQRLDPSGAGPAGSGEAVELGITSRRSPEDPSNGTSFSAAAAPSLDVGPDGSAVVTWQDIRVLPDGGYQSVVQVVRSADGGRTWAAVTPAAKERTQAFLPAVAISGDGAIGVSYYDFRNDVEGDETSSDQDGQLTTDAWLAVSRDGGTSWDERHLAGPFDLRPASPTYFLGAYQGLAGLADGFAATFVQAGPAAVEGAQDIFFARASPSTPASATGGVTRAVVSGESPVPHGLTDTCSPLAEPAGLRGYEFSPSMAVDPRNPKHLAAIWGQDFRDVAPVGVSFDGGAHWRELVPPGFLACANGPTGDYAPVDGHVAIGADGAAYAITVLQNASGSGSSIIASASRDGGITWRPQPVELDRAKPGEHTIEWSSIAADPIQPGVAYALWDRHYGAETAAGGSLQRGDQEVVRTTDWGEHWGAVPLTAPAGRVWTIGSAAVLADGAVVVAFTDRPAGTTVPGVADSGAGTVRTARLQPGSSVWSLSALRLGSGVVYAELAASGSTVYVGSFTGSSPTALLARSDDGGRTFSAASTLTPSVAPGGPSIASVLTLTLAAAPKGRLGVLYTVQTTDGRYEARGAKSLDRGATFAETSLAGPMDPYRLPAQGAAEAGGLGAFQGLVPVSGEAFGAAFTAINPPWADPIRGATDIAFARW